MSGEITGQIHITHINSWLFQELQLFCGTFLSEMKVRQIFFQG